MVDKSLADIFCHYSFFCAVDRTFSRPCCPNLRFCFTRVHMLGLRVWGDDLNVVLFEFLDDDTKLAQSCRNWLYGQHRYTVVPEPSMRVTLSALMGAGGNCHEHIDPCLESDSCGCLHGSSPLDKTFTREHSSTYSTW